jgi:hypothetical protein
MRRTERNNNRGTIAEVEENRIEISEEDRLTQEIERLVLGFEESLKEVEKEEKEEKAIEKGKSRIKEVLEDQDKDLEGRGRRE